MADVVQADVQSFPTQPGTGIGLALGLIGLTLTSTNFTVPVRLGGVIIAIAGGFILSN